LAEGHDFFRREALEHQRPVSRATLPAFSAAWMSAKFWALVLAVSAAAAVAGWVPFERTRRFPVVRSDRSHGIVSIAPPTIPPSVGARLEVEAGAASIPAEVERVDAGADAKVVLLRVPEGALDGPPGAPAFLRVPTGRASLVASLGKRDTP
jgi:hypothetical protein